MIATRAVTLMRPTNCWVSTAVHSVVPRECPHEPLTGSGRCSPEVSEVRWHTTPEIGIPTAQAQGGLAGRDPGEEQVAPGDRPCDGAVDSRPEPPCVGP